MTELGGRSSASSYTLGEILVTLAWLSLAGLVIGGVILDGSGIKRWGFGGFIILLRFWSYI